MFALDTHGSVARPILTAAEMRVAEEAAIAGGVTVEELMERAGRAVADIAWRVGAKTPALILCGPGNNGGDGYVAARILKERGVEVRVAQLAEPRTEAARAARARWDGRIEPLSGARPAPLVIDALFGTGLTRPLGSALAAALGEFAREARHSIAVDLPSGVDSDSGALLSPAPAFDITVALGALKPAHRLQPAARHCGEVVLGEIGVVGSGRLEEIARPLLAAPDPAAHKYSRGYVLVAAGEMAGAAELSASAALRAGAGYVALAGSWRGSAGPMALVDRRADNAEAIAGLIDDKRIGAVLIGPGLGSGNDGKARLAAALDSGRPLVLDADALTMLAEIGLERAAGLDEAAILTPHEGEFERLFGEIGGGKVERAREAARLAGSVVVYKGADTVIAHPDGRAVIAGLAPSWLASAGTGDVLAGIIAAMRARGLDAFAAARAGVWLHGEAARRAGPGLIADDLVARLPAALAACR